MYALGLVLYEILFGSMYPLPVGDRRALTPEDGSPRLPATASEVTTLGGLSDRAAEHALSLLRRLLHADPAERPTAHAVLADPFCIVVGAHGTNSTSPQERPGREGQDKHTLVLNALQQLGERGQGSVRRLKISNRDNLYQELRDFLAACVAECEQPGSLPSRLVVELAEADSPPHATGAERALDAYLSEAMRAERGLFSHSAAESAQCVLPATDGEASSNLSADYVAFGFALAYSLLFRIPADVAGRFPPVFYRILLEGTTLLSRDCALSELLRELEPFDSQLASQFRGTLLAHSVKDWGVERPGLRGVDVELTDANKSDVLRRQCVSVLVSSRMQAYAALRRGFWCVPGLREIVERESVRPEDLYDLLYDTAGRQRSEQHQRALARETEATDAWIRRSTKPCPGCQTRVEKNGGCMHISCLRCRHEFWWCCLRPYAETRHNMYQPCMQSQS